VHVIAWRKDSVHRQLAPATIRRKLSALSSLFEHLCERNAVTHNPVKGVKRPKANNNEGTTPVLSDTQAREILKAPPADTRKGVRDRAILATLLFHGIRREELCKLRVRDYQWCDDMMHFRIEGKSDKVRFIPVATEAQRLVYDYLKSSGHGEDLKGPQAIEPPIRV
jgi:site-specific recombinase XerD